MKKLLLILLSALSLTAFAQQKVAVYVTGQESGIKKVLGDQLVAAFAKSGKYMAIERTASFLAEMKREQNYQSTGAVDDSELSRLGKQFGVQLVCVADVSDVFRQKYVSARLIDVETAEVVNTANMSSPMSSMDELLTVTDFIANELTSETVQEKAAKAWALKKAKEEEEQMLLDGFAKGYIKCGNLYATISFSKTSGLGTDLAKACRIGGFNDWRVPTASELNEVKQACRNYYANKEYFSKIPNDNMEQLKKISSEEDGYKFRISYCETCVCYSWIMLPNGELYCDRWDNNRLAWLMFVRDAK